MLTQCLYSVPCSGRSLFTIFLAENVGFEPTVPFGITGFQDQPLKPLGQLSETVLDYLTTELFKCQALFINFFLAFFSKKSIHRVSRSSIHGRHLRKLFLTGVFNGFSGTECLHQSPASGRSDALNLIQHGMHLLLSPQGTVIFYGKPMGFILNSGKKPEALAVLIHRQLFIMKIQPSGPVIVSVISTHYCSRK